MMAKVRAERLRKIPAEPSPELRIPAAAAQTRVVSLAGIRLGSWESARAFKGIICVDISEFESYMPSHAVGSLWRVYPVHGLCEHGHPLSPVRDDPRFASPPRRRSFTCALRVVWCRWSPAESTAASTPSSASTHSRT